MYQDLSTVIGEGFRIWRANLRLCIPFIASMAGTLISMIPMAAAFIYLIYRMAASPAGYMTDLTEEEMIVQILTDGASVLTISALVSLASALLIGSFFSAGAIGMAISAIQSGHPGMKDMISSGWMHYKSMAFAQIIMIITGLAAASVVLVPIVIAAMSVIDLRSLEDHGLIDLLSDPSPEIAGIIAFGVLGIVIMMLLLSLLLAMVPYAIVAGRMGAVAAFRESLRFFRYNSFDVLIIWLIVVSLSMAISLPAQLFGQSDLAPLWSLAGIAFNVLVLAPLSTVWWSSLYISRTASREKPAHETTYIR